MRTKHLHTICLLLVIAGAFNWGLIGTGAFMGENWDLIALLLGVWPEVKWGAYITIGIAGVYLLLTHRKTCRRCSA